MKLSTEYILFGYPRPATAQEERAVAHLERRDGRPVRSGEHVVPNGFRLERTGR